jgi:Y-box-binding protein 1
MSTEQDTTVLSSESERFTGIVKWFNTKSGFGFITVCGNGIHTGRDIFAHHTGVRVSNMQYKYLVQGEYVDFTLIKSENENHEFNANDITGVMGGPTMCETRRLAQENQPERPEREDRPRTSYNSRRRSSDNDEDEQFVPVRPTRRPQSLSQGQGRGQGSRGPPRPKNDSMTM